jgi:Putative metallopeptidase
MSPAVKENLQPGRRLLAYALAILLSGAAPLLAQTAPPGAPNFEARIEETARAFASEPRLRRLTPQRRVTLVEFVVGNMLFVLEHELGHAVIGEMGLPVVGREEDAADTFATVQALAVADAFSFRSVGQAAEGWFLSDRRDRRQGNIVAYYGAHALDVQRAYQIVCLMVGYDSKKFKELADKTKLPEERRLSCQAEYRNTAWSWEALLKPHLRAPDRPKQRIDVVYQEGEGTLDLYARAFRAIRFLETIAEYAADRLVWPRPLVLEMRSCGAANAHWRGATRTLTLCYELAQEFAELHRDYAQAGKPPNRKRPRRS